MLTNPEDKSPPADVCKSPPAGADGDDSPSQLPVAFIDYFLRAPSAATLKAQSSITAGLPESAAANERLAASFKTQAVPCWASETSR